MTRPASTVARWAAMSDTERLDALCAAEAERDLYREATDVLRESATMFRRALERDRRSLARLLADITSPAPVPAPDAVGSTAAGDSTTSHTPDEPGQE